MSKLKRLPNGWYETVLGEISEEVMYGLSAEAVPYDGKHKYIRITDIDEMTSKFCPNPLSSPKGIVKEKYKLKTDDLLFARTGASVGKTYLYDKHDGDLYFAGYLIKFHIIGNDAKFIHAQTQTNEYRNWVKSVSVRSGQPGINAEEFKKLPIVIAPVREQKAIADIIQTWDMAIEKTESLITAKQKKFRWTIKSLCNISSGEKYKKLGLMYQFVNGEKLKENAPTGEYLEIGDVDIACKSYDVSGKLKLPVRGAVRVPKNTLLISTVRPTRGAITKTKSEVYVSSAFCRLEIDNDFIFYYLQQPIFSNFLRARQTGGTYPTVSNSDVLAFRIPDIPTVRQRKISCILNVMEREIILLTRLVNHYRIEKRGLMQKLLTGKWRLNP